MTNSPEQTIGETPGTTVTERLHDLPVTVFSTVMGLSGFTLAIQAMLHSYNAKPAWSLPFAVLATSLMLVLSAAYLTKLRRHFQAVKAELYHPIRLQFFPALSISLLLLSTVWIQSPAFAEPLWVSGATIQLAFTLYIINAWLHQTHFTIEHANPGWFIPVVGNIVVPIAGVRLEYVETSWFFFSVGLVFWLVLFTVVFYRLIFHAPMALKLTPTLFILLAPPAVGFISYVELSGGSDNFAKVMYYTAVFLALLLLSTTVRFVRVPFFISSWAYSFPLAALTVATYKMASLSNNPSMLLLANGLIILLAIVILWLVVKTAIAVKHKQICIPEN